MTSSVGTGKDGADGARQPEAEPDRRAFERLTPLREALTALLACCEQVPSTRVSVDAALDRIMAAPARAPCAIPSRSIALYDGWAVAAQDTLGASPYSPAFASAAPVRVASGEALPDFADAVLPLHGVVANAASAEIVSAAAPGEGVRTRGSDFAESEIIVAAGRRVRAVDLALLRAAGIQEVPVRIPRVRVISQSADGYWLAALARRAGAECWIEATDIRSPERLAEALARLNADFVIAIGADAASFERAMASAGELLVHGLALWPGGPIGCGVLRPRSEPATSVRRGVPVILAPPRVECVLAAWLLLAEPCLRRLAGAAYQDDGESLPLGRKIVSNPGISDLVLLRRAAANGAPQWEPLATGDIPFAAIAHADAWLLVEPECEGYAAGQIVFARFL